MVVRRFSRQEVNNNSENLKSGIEDLAIAEETGAINLADTSRITSVLMPLLLAQPKATIMTVSSGLAFPLIQQLPVEFREIIIPREYKGTLL